MKKPYTQKLCHPVCGLLSAAIVMPLALTLAGGELSVVLLKPAYSSKQRIEQARYDSGLLDHAHGSQALLLIARV